MWVYCIKCVDFHKLKIKKIELMKKITIIMLCKVLVL